MATKDNNFAYTTLITRASYLAGVIILAHSLRKQGSNYPLIVYYTETLQAPAIRALELEAPKLNLILHPCSPLLPRASIHVHLIAERFTDTWTKLRVFDCTRYDAVCYLDADMAIFRNMDAVFSHAPALAPDCIAANHACVRNLDRDPWAPADWTAANCAYTPLTHPGALTHPTQPPPPAEAEGRETYRLLNSGMFLYHPSERLWGEMQGFFDTTEKLATYKFPDQDFLAEFFRGRWTALGWQFNALKTMRYWHANLWRDDEVVCLHYIVDKPWAARVRGDGVAGYKGRDGVTHGWWWDEFAEWERARTEAGGEEVVGLVRRYVAKEDGGEESDPDMRAIGSQVQSFANNKAPGEEQQHDGAEGARNDETRQPGGPVLRRKVLGERGHGPVVRPNANGSSMMRP